MRIGYARTSTVDQVAGLEAQLRDLSAAGCEKIFQEQTSAVGPRAELGAAVEFMREGDALVVTKLDRLARSVPHLVEITRRLGTRAGRQHGEEAEGRQGSEWIWQWVLLVGGRLDT